MRLIGIPSNLKDDQELQTRALFERCLGESFPVIGLKSVEGLPFDLVELHGQVLGKPGYMDSIWVEPEYLRLENLKFVWPAVFRFPNGISLEGHASP